MDKVWNYEYMFASEAESFEERTFWPTLTHDVRNFFRNGELRHVWYNPPISKSIRFFMPIVWTSNSCAHIGIKHYVWNFRIGPSNYILLRPLRLAFAAAYKRVNDPVFDISSSLTRDELRKGLELTARLHLWNTSSRYQEMHEICQFEPEAGHQRLFQNFRYSEQPPSKYQHARSLKELPDSKFGGVEPTSAAGQLAGTSSLKIFWTAARLGMICRAS